MNTRSSSCGDGSAKRSIASTRQARIEKQAETLAKECAAKAAEVGIPLEDIQEEVGDIQELIASRLEEAAEADESNQQAPSKAAE